MKKNTSIEFKGFASAIFIQFSIFWGLNVQAISFNLFGRSSPPPAIRCDHILSASNVTTQSEPSEQNLPERLSLWQRARGGAASAANAVTAVASGAASGITSAATAAADYQATLDSLSNGIGHLAVIGNQVKEMSCQAAECSRVYTMTMVGQIPGAAWRILRFDADVEGIKNGVIIPLAGLLRDLRESEGDLEERSRVLARLSVFAVEVPLKLQKALPSQVAGWSGAMLSASISMATGVPMFAAGSDGDLGPALAGYVRQEIMSVIWEALTTPNLTMSQRIERFARIEETITMRILPRLAQDFGWYDLQNEIEAWRSANSGANIVAQE